MNNIKGTVYYSVDKLIKWTCVTLIAIMALISIVVYGASISGMLITSSFFIFYVQLPGMLLVRGLDQDYNHFSTKIMLGFFLGWAFNVLLVYLSDAVNTNLILYIFGPIMSFGYIALKMRQKSICKVRFSKISATFCTFVVLSLLFCLIGTQYQYLSPTKAEYAFISGDRAYHMGMANAISHGLPMESLWIKGVLIKYHIFTDILLSIPIRLFDVNADVICNSVAPILTTYCVGLSLYAFFREMSSKPERAGIYCLCFMLSGMYITRRWSSSLAFKFIFTNDNCAGFALSAMLIFIIAFSRWWEKYEKNDAANHKHLFVCIVLLMLISGIKGPVGAVVVAGCLGTIILGLLLRKIPIKTLLPIMMLTCSFLVVYILVLGSSGQVNDAGGATVSFGKIVDIAFWKDAIVDALKTFGIPKSIRLLIVLIVFCAFFFTVFFVPFFIGYARELFLVFSGRRVFIPSRVLVYASSMVGFMALLLLHYTGHNQVYFGLVTIMLAPIIAFWFIEDLERMGDESVYAKRTLKAIVIIMTITMTATSCSLAGYYARRGVDAYRSAIQKTDIYKYTSISKDEYNAMKWIKNNTEKDALIANDRYYSVPLENYNPENRWNNSFFLYEVYSNRFSYISGSAYDLDQRGSGLRKDRIKINLALYDPNNNERGRLAKDIGINYVIVSKRFSGKINLENDDYERCFSNNDIDIYKIRY